jgi:tetratricopeptide (TPR) repeat protein
MITMESKSLAPALQALVLTAGALTWSARPAAAAKAVQEHARAVEAAPLESFQQQLFDVAFRTASTVPVMPHIKTRSRDQEKVVVACLELGQPALARVYIEKIENWRRGVGYADLAFYLAQRGAPADAGQVKECLELARLEAEKIVNPEEAAPEASEVGSDEVVIEGFQAWRKDRIRARIARTYHVLGQPERAIEFEDGLETSEVGPVEVVRARTMKREDVGNVVMALGAVATEGELEKVRNAVDVSLELLRRFQGDRDTCTLLAQALDTCLEKTPLLYRADSFLALGTLALEQGDRKRALELAGRVDVVLEKKLATEDEIPIRARTAVLRHGAGDAEAKTRLDAALAQFGKAREQISNLRRADVLLPIAEAYASLGDVPQALVVYRRAAVDGAENPNGVPRADDLVALCCSMARSGVAPDAEQWRAIHRTFNGLREPW